MNGPDVIRDVVEAHQFASTSTSRNGVNTYRAGCTCDPAIEFDWYERETQHREHVYAAIFASARASSAPRHRERAGMNELTEDEMRAAIESMLDDEIERPGPLDPAWLAVWVMDIVQPTLDGLIARLASVKALHVQDDREGHNECVGCRDECLYCEGDHVWPCPTIRAVLGSGSHRYWCRLPDEPCSCGLCDFRAEAAALIAAVLGSDAHTEQKGTGE